VKEPPKAVPSSAPAHCGCYCAAVTSSSLRDLLFLPGRGGTGTATDVRGVVVDVALDQGVDTVAGFADGTARYLNHSGAAVIWEAPDRDVEARVEALLTAAAPILRAAAPIDGAVPAVPRSGHAQVAVLTTDAIHTGTGPFEGLARDPLGGPVIRAAFELMTLLMERSSRGEPDGPPA
jgi:hypothetical protein